ncbi:MAG: flagellar biosynthesis protein FlhB [Candidatus Margulisiibacteriota bacterium]
MGEEDSGEKTEEPTPHKLREARKKGQIVKSKEITSAILMLVSFFTLKASAVYIWEKIAEISFYTFNLIPEEFTEAVAGKILKDAMWIFLAAIAPLLFATFVVTLLVEFLQTGFLLSGEPLVPNLEKLNPIEGIKKMFALKQLVELLKSLIKMAIVIYLLYGAIRDQFFMVVISPQLNLWQIMGFTGSIIMDVVTRVGIAYIILAIFDYMYQHWEFMKSMRMSKKEIKDEYKRLEGDPMIKQRMRDAQRQMAQGRQMGAVPQADVVVTNPIHLALAIQYKPNVMKAPKILAKGRRLVAEEIKRIAQDHDIPIVENKPLAQALFKETEADQEVPPQYYKAVAQILAFVYNLKKKRKQRF